MTIIAGVDIGNATTEIVLADIRFNPPRPLIWDRAPTQGAKGSERAAAAAARLLRRMERRLESAEPGHRVDGVAVTRQVPVHTFAHAVDIPPADTGRFVMFGRSLPTPAGQGAGLGRPVAIEAEPITGQPVVLVASDPLGHRDTIRRVQRWLAAGSDVQALLLAGDEAHIVGLGLTNAGLTNAGLTNAGLTNAGLTTPHVPLPILDRVDTRIALDCDLVAVEVQAGPLKHLSDALWLRAAFAVRDLDSRDTSALVVVTQSLRGASSGAVGLLGHSVRPASPPGAPAYALHLADGRSIPLIGSAQFLREQPVGVVRAVSINDQVLPCDDAWVVETAQLIAHRQSGLQSHEQVALSVLQPGNQEGSANDPFTCLAQQWPLHVIGTESEAAYLGARTTPGAEKGTVVIDLGGGTADVVLGGDDAPGANPSIAMTAAGCGQLLTTATSSVLGISTAMAEWVKRGPAQRVEAPHLIANEDGQRQFSDSPLPSNSLGWLTAPGPAGPLAFAANLPLGEWRQLRLALKEAVIGQNLARMLTRPPTEQASVVLVGGPVGDDELFESLVRQLPWALLGRGNVAGMLGHRWAVAYGLTLLHQTQLHQALLHQTLPRRR